MRIHDPIKVGGIYATRSEDGTWRIIRVLAADDHAVHVRSYTDKFDELPRHVDVASLHWFIGHMPLAREGFEKEPRELIAVVPVSESELEGYRLYLDAVGDEPAAD